MPRVKEVDLSQVKPLSELHKAMFKIVVEQWGTYNANMKPKDCDFHKLERALQEAMVVYIGLRHNGNTVRSKDYNLNRNTIRRMFGNLNLTPEFFRNRPQAGRSIQLDKLGL